MEIIWNTGNILTCKYKQTKVLFNHPIEKLVVDDKLSIFIYTSPARAGQELVREEKRFFIFEPGDYEVGGISVTLWPSGSKSIVRVIGEDLDLIFTDSDILPNTALIKSISDLDILAVSVGSTGMTPEKATELLNKLEPKIVIPTGYKDFSEIQTFLKNESFNTEEVNTSIKLSSSDLDEEERRNVLLKPQAL
jgi:hypothetical protein